MIWTVFPANITNALYECETNHEMLYQQPNSFEQDTSRHRLFYARLSTTYSEKCILVNAVEVCSYFGLIPGATSSIPVYFCEILQSFRILNHLWQFLLYSVLDSHHTKRRKSTMHLQGMSTQLNDSEIPMSLKPDNLWIHWIERSTGTQWHYRWTLSKYVFNPFIQKKKTFMLYEE